MFLALPARRGRPEKGGAGPGDRDRLLNPIVGDGEVGTDRVFTGGPPEGAPILGAAYLTEPTATALRPSSMATQVPEFTSDWRFR